MRKQTQQSYIARMVNVVNYIQQNLDNELTFIGWILRKKQLKTCSEFDLIVIAKPQPTSKAEHE